MHVMKGHILCIFLVLLLGGTARAATQLSIEYSSLRYDRNSKVHTYSEPRVKYGNSTTSAHELVYDQNTGILLFTKNVVIRMPGVVLTAAKATFNRKTGKNTLWQATMYDSKNGAFIQADRIDQVNEEEYIIYRGVLTRCKQDDKAWDLRGYRIIYRVDNYAYSLSTSLHFYGLPIFYTPYFSWPTRRQRSTGLLMPTLTSVNSSDETKNYGWRLQLPYFIALDRDHDVTITADLIQRRGLGIDVDYLYAFTPDMSGQFHTWFIKENLHDRSTATENPGSLDWTRDDFDPNPLRFKYSFDHRQNILLGGQFFFHQHENSDNEINKEYADAAVDLDSHFSRTVSLIFPWNSGSLSLSHETADDFVYQSTYDKTTDQETHLNRQPAVSVSQRFSSIAGTPVTVNLSGTGTEYNRISGWNGKLQQSTVQVKAPFFIDFLNIWPSVQRTWTHLDASYEAAGGQSSPEPESFGWQIDKRDLEFNFEVYRLFYNDADVATRKLSIKPRLIYSEVQDIDQSADDTTSFLDTIYSWKTLTYKLETRYLVKDPETKTVRTFFSLDLTQIYNLQMEEDRDWLNQPPSLETEPGNPQLPLRVQLTLTPVNLFSAGLFYRFDHEKSRVVETGISLSAGSAEGDSFSLSYTDNETAYYDPYNTSHPTASIYSVAHTLKISDRWTLSLSGTWDQNRADLSTRYDETTGIRRLDRQLTDLNATLLYNHGCYQFSAAYIEDIKNRLVNGMTEEFLEQKVILTLRFNVLPATVGGSAVQTTGAQYQQGFLLP